MTAQLLLVPTELGFLVLIIVAVLLFGGSRLAGVGKGAGRAIREFKEETAGLHKEDEEKKLEEGRHSIDGDVVETRRTTETETRSSE